MDKSESLNLEVEGEEMDWEERGACGGSPSDNPPSSPDLHRNCLAECPESSSPPVVYDTETTVFTDQETFLLKIHKPFLDYVSPIESHLVDELRRVEALSSEDEQSIAKEEGRRKRARKLWSMLHKIPEEDFACSFVPKLERVYPHLMSGLKFRLEDGVHSDSNKCLRHAMRRRIKLMRLIDLLPSFQCCDIEDYRRLSSCQHCGDKEWEEVFCLLKAHASNPRLCIAVEEMLRKKKIRAPERFREVAIGGFLCTCVTSQLPCSPEDSEVKLGTHFFGLKMDPERESSTAYPSSPRSSKMTDVDSRVDSGFGYDLDAEEFQSVLYSDIQEFKTQISKDQYKTMEDEINTALVRASNIRTDYRFLEKVRDDARSLAREVKDETRTAETNQQLQALLQQAQEFISTIRTFFQELQAVWAKVEDLEEYFTFTLPDDLKMYLRIRHHLLRNEVLECRHFVEKASTVFDEVIAFCRPVPPAE